MYPQHLLIMLLGIMLACQPNEEPTKIPAPADPQVLLDTDRAFSQLSYDKGMNHAFASYIADNGVVLRNNSFPIVGKDSVLSRHFSRPDTTFRLTWEPMYADIAKSGDLGYTYGTYLVSSVAGDSLGTGTYVSIWKQQADSAWKFVFDAGNEGL